MSDVVGVRFKSAGKTYYFDPQKLEIHEGKSVIVETSRGLEYGKVVVGRKQLGDNDFSKPLKPVIRVATAEDEKRHEENKVKEKEAGKIFVEKIREHKMEMKLVDVEFTFDGSKILFYFTADGRVDFRELVRDLALVFKTRIELRQIGVRDESKTMGSIGICGRDLCCAKFLDEFVPVSVKMAKEQGLSLNPTKISGSCGRLMCCLKYEQDTYEELLREAPRVGASVTTPTGEGVVTEVSLLKELVKVKFESETEKTIREYKFNEIETAKKGPKKQQLNEEQN